jgi:ribosomal protein S18 acetylase RimI-like enzyme
MERIIDLGDDDRERAMPLLIESFEGIYRWHAKRTLHRIERVRGLEIDGTLAGISMLERLAPEVGYVYYLAVRANRRRQGVGHRLLEDAMNLFRTEGAKIIYAAAEEDNAPSLALFRSHGFRPIERKELGYQEGGLGAWGLRSRMMLVSGEVLLGRWLQAPVSGGKESPSKGPRFGERTP